MTDALHFAALQFTNEAFYSAFSARDVAAMEDLWDRDARSSCLHPGWGPLFGYDAILASWRDLFDSPNSPQINCQAPTVSVYGDLGMVVCFEALPGGYLMATNGFIRRGAVWKMVHPQAGPTETTPPKLAGGGAGGSTAIN